MQKIIYILTLQNQEICKILTQCNSGILNWIKKLFFYRFITDKIRNCDIAIHRQNYRQNMLNQLMFA